MNKIKFWLSKYLANSWMNNTFFLAQAAHTLLGYSIMTTVAYFSNTSPLYLGIFGGLFLTYAMIKEFVYDKNFETPKQTNTDGWTDFAFLCLGAIIGFGISMIKDNK